MINAENLHKLKLEIKNQAFCRENQKTIYSFSAIPVTLGSFTSLARWETPP